MPIASHLKSTAVRWPKKTPIAWKTESITPPSLAYGDSGIGTAAVPLLDRAFAVLRSHERVAVIRGRDERLLDRARADPADQVPHRARLVVRARRSSATEGLLADDRAGRLVVDVEVPGRVP